MNSEFKEKLKKLFYLIIFCLSPVKQIPHLRLSIVAWVRTNLGFRIYPVGHDLLPVKFIGQYIPPVVGLCEIFSSKKILKIFLPFALLLICQVPALLQFDFQLNIIQRLAQLVLLVFFAQFLILRCSREEICNYSKIILRFSYIVYLINLLICNTNFPFSRMNLERHPGITGDPNYSGMLYLIIFTIFLDNRLKKHALLVLPLIMLTLSKGASISLFFFGLMTYIFKNISLDNGRKLRKVLIYSICLFPFFILFVKLLMPRDFYPVFFDVFRERSYIYFGYLDVFMNNPFGVGFFNAINVVDLKQSAAPFLIEGKVNFNLQQHCFPLQILSEFGIAGYFIYVWMVAGLLKASEQTTPFLATGVVAFFIGSLFLNMSNEFSLYLLIAYVFSDAKLDSCSFVSFLSTARKKSC